MIALLSFGAVLGLVYWESGALTSPGRLHGSHARVDGLRGRRGCTRCHGDGPGDMVTACLACHEPIAVQHRTGAGLHGTLDAAEFAACARCHAEHTDGQLALVSATSFRVAGVPDPTRFDHARVAEYTLAGRHDALACVRCHARADAAVLAPGEWRYLGMTQQCVACHRDVHQGSYGPDCASCHGQTHPFPEAPEFVHTAAFALAGGHAHVACKACHAAGTAFAIGTLQRRGTPARVRPCIACHRSPHHARFIQLVAARTGAGETGACERCHSAKDDTFLRPAAAMPPTLHADTGFPLTPPHQQVRCEQCHATVGARAPLADDGDLPVRFAALFPGRSARACEACHKDPHAGQFDAGATHGRCIACHAADRFFPAQFELAQHAKTAFALTGAHEAVACRACHAETHGVRRFARTPVACVRCHKDVHRGAFDGPHKPARVDGRVGCARCHSTASFRDVQWPPDVHGRWTGYPLRGGHLKATCRACHRPEQGRVREAVSLGKAPTTCSACHADPHAGQFRHEGATDCARCHADAAPFTKPTFDHQTDSRFPLDETHRTVSCTACHQAVAVGAGRTVVRYRPLGRRCQDCHGFTGAREHAA